MQWRITSDKAIYQNYPLIVARRLIGFFATIRLGLDPGLAQWSLL